MLPKKGMSYGELIVDNILGLDNDYESFGEKLGKAVDEDELSFLKDAAVGVYEGAKEFITNPVETTKEVVTNIKDSVQRLGTEDLDTRLKSMYGVDYTQATDEQVNAAREAVIGDALTAMELIPAAKVTVSAVKAGSAAIPSGVKADVVGQTKALLSGDTEFLKGTPTERSGTAGVGAEVVGQDDVSLDDITDYMDSEVQPAKPKAELTKPKKDVAPLVRPNEKRTAMFARTAEGLHPNHDELIRRKNSDISKLESSDFYSPILPFIKNIAIGSKGIKGSNVKKLLEKRANVNKTQLYWSGLLNEIDSDTIYDKDTLVNLARQNIPKIEIVTNTGGGSARYKDLQRIPLVEDSSTDKFVTKQSLPVPGHKRFQGQPGAEPYNYTELIAINKNPKGNFYQAAESHWGYGGTAIAHTRLSEYTHNGNEFIVVEELQSDMAQVATDNRNKDLEVATKENSTNEIPLTAGDISNSLTDSSSELVSNFYITEAPSNFKFTNRFEQELEYISQNFYNKSFNDLASEQEFIEVSETVLSDLMFKFANLKFKYENNEINLAEVMQKLTTDMPGITERVLARETYENLVSTPIDKIFSNAFSDYVFGKSTIKNNRDLKYKIADLFDTAPSIADFKKANLSMLKQSEATRVSLLMAIKDAKKNNINKIYVVPPKTAAYYHDFSKDTADKIYNSTLNKVLRVLNNETNNAIKYKRKNPEGIRFPISKPIGRAGSWEFDNSQVAMEIDITDFDMPDRPQFRFAEGGVVKDMDNQIKMAFMNEGGLKDDGMKRDPVSGNEVPNGSMASEVRDDIPAQLSEGEYVVPADVVRYLGVKHFEDLRNKAKSGLQNMEANGRIGGEPVPVGGPKAAPIPYMAEGGDLTPDEMNEIKMLMNQGGMVMGAVDGTDVSPYSNISPYSSSPPKFTGGFSWEQNVEDVTTTDPELPTESKTLYGPNGEVVTLTLPKDQQKYDELVAQGYTETQPVTPTVRSGGDGSSTPPPPAVGTQTEGAFGFGTFGQGVDWTDPEQAMKFIDGEYTPIDPKTRKAVVGAGMIIGGPLALLSGAATTYDALEDISSLRASVIIAKAYGNTAAEQHAQAKLEDYLAQAPAVATGIVGDWLAKGTGKAGNLFKSLGINLSGDPEDWDNQQEELQKLRDDSKKKKPVTPTVDKVDPSRTFKTSDKDTRSETVALKARIDDDRESFAEKIQKEAKAIADKAANTGKSIAEVGREKAPSSAAKSPTQKAAAEGDPRAGMYNKGGLMKKKRKK